MRIGVPSGESILARELFSRKEVSIIEAALLEKSLSIMIPGRNHLHRVQIGDYIQ